VDVHRSDLVPVSRAPRPSAVERRCVGSQREEAARARDEVVGSAAVDVVAGQVGLGVRIPCQLQTVGRKRLLAGQAERRRGRKVVDRVAAVGRVVNACYISMIPGADYIITVP
jgi:hypothetical protein